MASPSNAAVVTNDGKISILPHISIFEQALAWAEVEGVELVEQDGKILLKASGMYETVEAASKMLTGITTAWVKAGMPRS